MRRQIKIATVVLWGLVILNPSSAMADSRATEKSARGFWKVEDCKKVSEHAGAILHYSVKLLAEADSESKKGNKDASDELYKGAMFLSEISANAAKNFEAFCKG